VAAARERIARVRPLAPADLETMRSKRAEPRIPFGAIVELGLLAPGARLSDERGRIRAHVRADGTLALDSSERTQGSIHRLGAAVQGKAACNGWTYWHHEVEGKLKPIDSLRELARRQLAVVPPQPLIAAE
jgi:modification methylase